MLAYHYAVLIAPQIFFLGTIFFLVAALTRRVIVVYLQGAALYAIYFMGLAAVSADAQPAAVLAGGVRSRSGYCC